MNVLFDTSFLVQLDRENREAIDLGKNIFDKGYQTYISVVTVTEMMTGAKLVQNSQEANKSVLSILNLFDWINVDDKIAFRASEIMAFSFSNKKIIQFQDVLIAATAIEIGAQYLITENKKDFVLIPTLKDKIFTIDELSAKLD